MENRYENLILEFEDNIKRTISEINRLKDENNRLKNDLLTRDRDFKQTTKDLLDLQNRYETLMSSSELTLSVTDRKKSRDFFSNLLDDINHCISRIEKL